LTLFVLLFDDGPTEAMAVPLLAQTGAILTAAPTAFALRRAGLRLTRPAKSKPRP
jgi:hypothetical protein